MGIFDNLTPKKKSEPVINASENLLTLTDVVAPSAVSIGPRNINISGTMARVFYAVSYPRYLTDGWLEPILNMEKELDVSIVIHPINTAETLKKFQKKVAEVQSQINMRAARGEVRDPQL